MKLELIPTGVRWGDDEWTFVHPVPVVVSYPKEDVDAEIIGYWRNDEDDLLISTNKEYGGYFEELGLYLTNLRSRWIKSVKTLCPMEVKNDSIQAHRK